MKVIKKGEGEAEIVVMGSLHGDEPAGKKAIEKLLQEKEDFNRPVKFIVANEKALAKDRRYLDVDANSSFPGDSNSDMHEERLAAKLTEEIREKTVIDLHTTMSTDEPFSTMKSTDEETIELVKDANVKRTVHFPEDSGVSIEVAGKGIIVETGPQGTKEAANDSYKILKNFLKSKGVIDGDYGRSEPGIFRYIDTVKGDWKFKAQNFKLVEKGKVYASRDGEELAADEDFYPVLMSTNGYEGKLGHKAKKIK